jgi:hypothetical protein
MPRAQRQQRGDDMVSDSDASDDERAWVQPMRRTWEDIEEDDKGELKSQQLVLEQTIKDKMIVETGCVCFVVMALLRVDVVHPVSSAHPAFIVRIVSLQHRRPGCTTPSLVRTQQTRCTVLLPFSSALAHSFAVSLCLCSVSLLSLFSLSLSCWRCTTAPNIHPNICIHRHKIKQK